jgi:hypothetical protein
MANITVKDLVGYSDSGRFIQDLSEEELDLQGGGKCHYNGEWWTWYRPY